MINWRMPKGGGAGAYLRRAQDIEEQVKFARNRRACVQAGGHIGIYPQTLAGHFEQVYTFEPELENFRCLVANVTAPNVYAACGILGAKRGCVQLRVSTQSGGHGVGTEGGPVPTFRIDDLNLKNCDAIFLDVEGYEMAAILGAWRTLTEQKPLVVIEENKKMARFGRAPGDIERRLAPLGYRVALRIHEDIVLCP